MTEGFLSGFFGVVYWSCLTLIGRGFWMLPECGGGGLNQPAPSRSPKNTVKNQKNFFDFPKVHNELGKVTKFGTSRTDGEMDV